MAVDYDLRSAQKNAAPPKPKKKPPPASNKDGQNAALFHEHWWLKAASDGRYAEVEAREGEAVVGRLPYVVTSRYGFTQLTMPPFTHLLGPFVESGDGKHQTMLKTRVAIVKQLIGKLPKHDFFFQICDPSCDGGLALADGLAFQECGFDVKQQYTFHIDCRNSPDALLAGMNLKARQHIRMAEKVYKVVALDQAEPFVAFYLKCLEAKRLKPNIPLDRFAALYAECRARNCSQVFAAFDENGAALAMTFVVWDRRAMYYLLSVRAPDLPDRGSVNLLIWSVMQKAHDLGLRFDLDGVSTTGTAQFLSSFGGELRTRMIVTASGRLFASLQQAKSLLGLNTDNNFS